MDLEDVLLGVGRLAMLVWYLGPDPNDMWAYPSYRTGRWGPWYRRMWRVGLWLWRAVVIGFVVVLAVAIARLP